MEIFLNFKEIQSEGLEEILKIRLILELIILLKKISKEFKQIWNNNFFAITKIEIKFKFQNFKLLKFENLKFLIHWNS